MKFVLGAVLMIVIVGTGAYLLGFWSPGDVLMGRWGTSMPAGGPVNAGAVRERLNQLDTKSGRVVEQVGAYVSDAELTGKIKSKMTLDDVVRARTIDVSTAAGSVTLGGTVRSAAEHDQAVKLARDTNGVTKVVDHLVVVP